MWRAFNPLSCLLLVAVASKAAPTGDEAGRLSQARSFPPPPCRTWEHLPVCTWFCAPSCLHLIGDTLCAGDTEGSLGRDRVLDLGEKIDLGCEARCPQHQLVPGDPRHLLQLCCTGWQVQTEHRKAQTLLLIPTISFNWQNTLLHILFPGVARDLCRPRDWLPGVFFRYVGILNIFFDKVTKHFVDWDVMVVRFSYPLLKSTLCGEPAMVFWTIIKSSNHEITGSVDVVNKVRKVMVIY